MTEKEKKSFMDLCRKYGIKTSRTAVAPMLEKEGKQCPLTKECLEKIMKRAAK